MTHQFCYKTNPEQSGVGERVKRHRDRPAGVICQVWRRVARGRGLSDRISTGSAGGEALTSEAIVTQINGLNNREVF